MFPTIRAISRGAAGGALAAALAAALWASPAAASTLEGRIVLEERGRPSRDRSLDLRAAVVWYEPDGARAKPRPERAEMSTRRKRFEPSVLVVPVGSTVDFTNFDPILHNAFSVSEPQPFDLGLVAAGDGKEVTFGRAGLVQVFCNVHHSMYANVLVVDTPYFAVADEQGRFRIEGVPAGSGVLRFWHERATEASRRVFVPAPGELELALEVSVPRVPPHRNKFGRRYRRGAYD